MAGDRLIYTRTTAGQKDLLSVKLDGSGTATLAATASDEFFLGLAGSRVIYLRANGSGYDLRSVAPDGSGDLLLAANVLGDPYGTYVLLDGSWVVFTSLASGAGDLYAVQADGTGLTRLASGPTRESLSGYPASCLDPTTGLIVYTRDEGSGNTSIHGIQPDGSGAVQLTAALPGAGPAVIGGGRVVYWTRNTSGGFSISSARLDGSGTAALATDPTVDQRGNLLAGNRLIYGVTLSASVSEVHAVNLDGSGDTLLSPTGQQFSAQALAGDQVVLWQGTYSTPTTRLYLAKTDGTALTPITADGGSAYFEGTIDNRIYFVLQQAGQSDLFSCALDGSGVVTLGSRTDANELAPVKAGDRVVYDLDSVTTRSRSGIVSVKPDGTGAITLATGPCAVAFVQ